MLPFKLVRNDDGEIEFIETPLTGYDLLGTPKLNKGCAFTREERELFKLDGLLPNQVETLDQQVARMYAQYQEHQSNLGKNIYLNVLHDYNETLFYKLTSQYLEEMLPIIYTPTVGEAVERFSLEHRKTRGIYISFPDRDKISTILDHRLPQEVDLIVTTDGEAVLGIGDQGIGGINIATAKLMVYTLCGGISPHRVLPIQLDLGTNNPQLLNDPMYVGWRHERIQGQDYIDFIDQFVKAIIKKFPQVLLHWEDLGRDNARHILDTYRQKFCTFNGDIQGTGSVALACVLAACTTTQTKLEDQRIVILGAGTAGVGIADQIHAALKRSGLSDQEAYKRFWLLDRSGLLVEDSSLLSFQKPYARSRADVAHWSVANPNNITLLDVVKNIKPTILIGCSTATGAFSEEIIKTMAQHVEHPLIMPLSNPTSKSEARPDDLFHWTNGKALIATGSPFPDILLDDRRIRIAQSNNALAFPGIGLGSIAAKASYLTDDMLWAATEALSQCSPILHAHQSNQSTLLPKLSEAKFVSRQIALAVASQARKEGVAQIDPKIDLNLAINRVIWEPRYYRYRKS